MPEKGKNSYPAYGKCDKKVKKNSFCQKRWG